MDGEFLCAESTGYQKAIGGGNILVFARGIFHMLCWHVKLQLMPLACYPTLLCRSLVVVYVQVQR